LTSSRAPGNEQIASGLESLTDATAVTLRRHDGDHFQYRPGLADVARSGRRVLVTITLCTWAQVSRSPPVIS
jgi:hypothetical protein